MKKLISQLLILTLPVLMVACGDSPEDRYEEGFTQGRAEGKTQGYDEGYDKGHAEGDSAGYERAKTYFESAGYDEGKVDGSKLGYSQGYANGWSVGNNETRPAAYSTGYADGNTDGKADGYDRGYDSGYDDGWDHRDDELYDSGYAVGYKKGEANSYGSGYVSGYYAGERDGEADGYDLGYDDGYGDGYDIGFEDGEWDAFSLGKSKKMKGYANLISMVHNDMIDYTKIKMPKSTSRGLVVKGEVLFSESSLTNKDTMKRQAVAEQYLVMEMANQVKGKFGLSAERSIKIAKAANHFRKFSSKRALTSEDTNAYASEIIGSDFKSIEKAFDKGMKGDLTGYTSILSKAAEKNDTTPENISIIIAKYFM